MVDKDAASPNPPPLDDAVWTYRGYRMRPGEFNTAMVHLYRGEISRANIWRSRLDSTTNWAVVTTAGLLTFSFGSASNSHVIILLGLLMICIFLVIEARRYRYYELWSLRIRLLETDFFAAMLTPPFAPHQEWATRLADSLLTPSYPITFVEAIGRRLRRNFIWLFLVLGLAWLVKLQLHPQMATSVNHLVRNADIGPFPGEFVMIIVVLFFLGLLLLALLTVGLQESAGEVLPRHEALNISNELLSSIASAANYVLPEDIRFRRRHEHLAIIITDKPEPVGRQLLTLLNRGVTALEGRGMYSGQPRAVLLCAIAPAETERLKSTVYSIDENAFVVVNATEEILGAGFGSLQPRWRHAPKGENDEV